MVVEFTCLRIAEAQMQVKVRMLFGQVLQVLVHHQLGIIAQAIKQPRLATGLLLPIWSALPSDHLAVNRIVDGEGRSWLGRLVFDDHVLRLFSALGIDRKETLPASAIAKAVAAGRSIDVTHPFPLTINRSIVNGSQRIELVGFPADRLAWLKAAGCFTEVIQYRTRVFVPVALAEAILETVLEATT